MIKLMPVGYQVTSRVAALRCVTGQFVQQSVESVKQNAVLRILQDCMEVSGEHGRFIPRERVPVAPMARTLSGPISELFPQCILLYCSNCKPAVSDAMKGVSPFVRKLHEFSRSSCSHLLVCSVSKDGQCSLRNSRIKCNSLATQSNFLFYLLSNTEFCWQVFTYYLFTEVGGLNTILLNWSYLETCCDGLLQGIQKS